MVEVSEVVLEDIEVREVVLENVKWALRAKISSLVLEIIKMVLLVVEVSEVIGVGEAVAKVMAGLFI